MLINATARKDQTCLMTRLIELGGDPACGDNEGRSCLHLAANNDSASAVRILLQYKVRNISHDIINHDILSDSQLVTELN